MKYSPEEPIFEVLYEDEFLLAITKLPGLSMHKDRNADFPSITQLAEGYAQHTAQSPNAKVYPVNSLEMDVSGILLFAKNENTLESIKRFWHNTHTRYVALVEGQLPDFQGTVNNHLEVTLDGYTHASAVAPNSKRASTFYRTLKTSRQYTLVELRPNTSIQHQMRVHMSDLGTPIVNDLTYGEPSDAIKDRIGLHLFFMSLRHPVTNNLLKLSIPHPYKFKSFFRSTRGRGGNRSTSSFNRRGSDNRRPFNRNSRGSDNRRPFNRDTRSNDNRRPLNRDTRSSNRRPSSRDDRGSDNRRPFNRDTRSNDNRRPLNRDDRGSDNRRPSSRDDRGSDNRRPSSRDDRGSDNRRSFNRDDRGSDNRRSSSRDDRGSDNRRSFNRDDRGSDNRRSSSRDDRNRDSRSGENKDKLSDED